MPTISASWTQERLDQLKILWADGKSATQIEIIFNCELTRSAILGKVNRLKLAKRRTSIHHPPTNANRLKKPREPKVKKLTVKKIQVQIDSEPETILKYIEAKDKMLEAEHGRCVWPYGDPGTDNFYYCGGLTNNHHYCKEHRAIGIRLPEARRSRLRIVREY